MSRFFYFGGCIIRGGYRIFSVPKRKATAPPAREGFCCEARLRAEQQKGWAGNVFSRNFSSQKKRIVGSEISHFRAMIFLLYDYLLEKNFGVVSNTLGSGFLDSTARSPIFAFHTKWNFISKSRISFLKADRGAGIRVGPGFPISYPVYNLEKKESI